MRVLLTVGLAISVGGCGGVRDAQRAKLDAHRVEQATAQYQAASDNLGRCVAAKLVAVAHADLGDVANAQAWRAREAVDCQAALMALGPMQDLDSKTDAFE